MAHYHIVELSAYNNMKILIIPDSFKGSITAIEVAKAIETGIKKRLPEADCMTLGLADGGEGSLELWLSTGVGSLRQLQVANALGKPVTAGYGWDEHAKCAFIEMAQASGMAALSDEILNPALANTYGTGQLIKHAIEAGSEKIVLALGGSATIDGGTGLLQALGARFYNEKGEEITPLINPLIDFYTVDFSSMIDLSSVEWILLTDVANRLTGLEGAAYVFLPQKGADPTMIEILDGQMTKWNKALFEQTGMDAAESRGSGAAGGMGIPFLALTDATLLSGFDWFATRLNLDDRLPGFEVVITGEGKIDQQTMMGKGPGRVAKLAKDARCKVLAVTGKAEGSFEIFDKVVQLTNTRISTTMAMSRARELLVRAGEECATFISASARRPSF